MVSGKEDSDPCRAHPRGQECQSRLGIPSCQGLQRLEAGSPGVPTAECEAGTILNRPLCFQDEHAAPALLQLETGSRGVVHGCIHNPMGRAVSIHVHPIHPDTQMPGQAEDGEGIRSDDRTSLAQPDLFSPTSGTAPGLPILLPLIESTSPDGFNHPLATFHWPRGPSQEILHFCRAFR